MSDMTHSQAEEALRPATRKTSPRPRGRAGRPSGARGGRVSTTSTTTSLDEVAPRRGGARGDRRRRRGRGDRRGDRGGGRRAGRGRSSRRWSRRSSRRSSERESRELEEPAPAGASRTSCSTPPTAGRGDEDDELGGWVKDETRTRRSSRSRAPTTGRAAGTSCTPTRATRTRCAPTWATSWPPAAWRTGSSRSSSRWRTWSSSRTARRSPSRRRSSPATCWCAATSTTTPGAPSATPRG